MSRLLCLFGVASDLVNQLAHPLIFPSFVLVFMGIDAIQGAPLSVRSWGFYAGGLYAYNIIQCPMETIHGRQSAMHNVAAGGILGYVGVSRGRLGVPFVSPYILYGMRYPGLVGAAVYGAIAGGMATLGGKPW
eukprot:g10126.t1 g10126   contig4:1275062-1275704(+)